MAQNSGSVGPAASRPVMTSVYVIRHAESEANAGNYFASHSDSQLTERGVTQVKALAEGFANVTLHAVYSSDLSRAVKTVAPLAQARGLAVRQLPMLRERNMGRLTGMSFEAAKTDFPELWAQLVARDPVARPPGGESQVDLSERVRRVLEEILPHHRGESIAIGSHGGTIHHLVRQLLGVQGLELMFWLAVSNASVTRVDLTEVKPGVIAPRLAYANRVVAVAGEAMFP